MQQALFAENHPKTIILQNALITLAALRFMRASVASYTSHHDASSAVSEARVKQARFADVITDWHTATSHRHN